MTLVAIIGFGAVARGIHMPAYSRLSGKVRVVAACDPNSSARANARDKWHIPEVFDDPHEMLKSIKVDVVAVCTPPWLHHQQVLMVLDHGCHVFCEKPVADSLAQVDELIEASEKAGRLVVVNNQFPWMNIHWEAKNLVGSPQFGELLYLHAWHTMRTNDVTEAGWRGELQRRLCFEFGVHVLDLVRFFFNDNPVRLMAHMPNPGRRAKCDVINVITLEFLDGRGASIVLDRLSRGPERYLDLRLDGEHAIVHTSIGGQVRFQAGVHTREMRPFLDFSFAKGGQAVLQNGNRKAVVAKDDVNPFSSATARHFASFLQAIEDGSTPRCNVRDNRNTLALVMAAYESAESGKWVEMEYGVLGRNTLASV